MTSKKPIGVTRVFSIKEVSVEVTGGDRLCLQQALYKYPTGDSDVFFRFIRKSKDGRYLAQRGQAGCPELAVYEQLISLIRKVI